MRGHKNSSDLRADWICRLQWLMRRRLQLTGIILYLLSQSFGQLDTIIIWNTYQSVPSHWVMLRDGLDTQKWLPVYLHRVNHQHALIAHLGVNDDVALFWFYRLGLINYTVNDRGSEGGLGNQEPYVNGFNRICQSKRYMSPQMIMFRQSCSLCTCCPLATKCAALKYLIIVFIVALLSQFTTD